MKQEPGRQQPGISGLKAGEDVNSCGCQDPPRLDPSTTIRFKAFNGEVGITREDQQWLQHYRRQYLERYRQRGLIPPITSFT